MHCGLFTQILGIMATPLYQSDQSRMWPDLHPQFWPQLGPGPKSGEPLVEYDFILSSQVNENLRKQA